MPGIKSIRSVLLIVWILLPVLYAIPPTTHAFQPVAPNRRPNIIVILADDLGFADAGFNGSKVIPTPHLDTLAKSGVHFTNGYVTAPLCSPTRAGLLTGRYQQRFGHEYNLPPGTSGGLDLRQKTIADRMKTAGYVTGAIGKWHLGEAERFHPLNRGFDEYYGFLGGAHSYFESNDDGRDPILRGRIPAKLDDYLTDAMANEASSFIKRHRENAFFLYLAFNAVHTPMQAPTEIVQQFSEIADTRRRTYAAMVKKMDDAVGRVVTTLHENGLRDRTLLFFLNDNGGAIAPWTSVNGSSNVPLRGGKTQTLEGGIRVPFIMSWPGMLPSGRIDDRPVISLDILSTALGAAGVVIDPAWKLDGVNLLPYLTSQTTQAPHSALFWRHKEQFAVRKGNWKLVVYRDRERTPQLSKLELYNLAEDIGEQVDRSAENPEIVRELSKLWQNWNRSNITISKSELETEQ